MKARLGIITIVYLVSAIAIFGTSAIGKISSDYNSEEVLLRDPFFKFLTAGQLLKIVAAIEITVIAVILATMAKSPAFGVYVTLWLSTVFMLYRIGFWLAPPFPGSCKCFGVGGVFGKSSTVDTLGFVLLIYMLTFGGLLAYMSKAPVRRRPLNDSTLSYSRS